MRTAYHLDFETRSRADLKKVGAARYAADPSTRILMFAIRKGNGPILLWLNPAFGVPCSTNAAALALFKEACSDPLALIYAHNAPFEMFVAHYRLLADVGLPMFAVEKLRCTMAMARKAGLRVSLENVGEDLGLRQLKFGYGYNLIRKFSIPEKKTGQFIEPKDEPKLFQEFGVYCVQDVASESEAHVKLAPFELKGMALETFLFDLRMNLRGFPVNVSALRHAQSIIEGIQTKVAAEFRELTGLEPTQREKIQALLSVEFEADLANMRGKTIDKFLKELDEAEKAEDDGEETGEIELPDTQNVKLRRILELYKQVRFAAVKKVKTMLDCVCPDGYIRGMFTWHGAGTGRWTSQKVQAQNFRTPKATDPHGIYEMICNGCSAEEIDLLYGNPLEAIADCIRNFIKPHQGRMFDADYSGIEARIVAWLCGEEWRLKVFRTHGKIYEASASEMFGIPLDKVTKPIRQKGKVAELALQYQGAEGALKKMGALEMGVKEAELEEIKVAWRKANPNIVSGWYELDEVAMQALKVPNTTLTALNGRVKFKYTKVAGIPYLLLTLPSGRNIAYPHPRLEEIPFQGDKERMKLSFTYYGQIKGKNWGRVAMYGGKWMENIAQGTAADFMGAGAVNAEKAGFPAWALIHDQELAPAVPGRTVTEFVAALTLLPEWADGMPLKADGEEADFYTKAA